MGSGPPAYTTQLHAACAWEEPLHTHKLDDHVMAHQDHHVIDLNKPRVSLTERSTGQRFRQTGT